MRSRLIGRPYSSANPPERRRETRADKEKKRFPMIDERIAKLHDWVPYSDFPNHTGAGLQNTGNTCFLNSVLQMIVHTPQLAQTLIHSKDKRMCRDQYPCAHCELRKHVIEAMKSTKSIHTVIAQNFLPVVFPDHEDGDQEDAHEMLILLLDALDPPLPKQPNGKEHSLAEKSTPIQQIFAVTLKHHFQCKTCGFERVNYEDTTQLSLAFPETEKRGGKWYKGGEVSLDALFERYFKDETIDFECAGSCKGMVKAKETTTLLRAPNILLAHLSRFDEYGRKNRTTVVVDEELSLWKHANDYSFLDLNDRERDYSYKLIGIIEHQGTSPQYGHYMCAMKGINTPKWFLFNDTYVSSMSMAEALRREPYVLCYTKVVDPKRERAEDVRPRSYSVPAPIVTTIETGGWGDGWSLEAD